MTEISSPMTPLTSPSRRTVCSQTCNTKKTLDPVSTTTTLSCVVVVGHISRAVVVCVIQIARKKETLHHGSYVFPSMGTYGKEVYGNEGLGREPKEALRNSATVILTDPPWNVDHHGSVFSHTHTLVFNYFSSARKRCVF
jgi:hypothetical protein